MALLNDVRATLLKFSAQLRFTYRAAASALLMSVATGVIVYFVGFIPNSWWLTIPLPFYLLARFYMPVQELPLSDRMDGAYRSLRASGLSRAGY